MKLRITGRGNFSNLAGQVLADARDLAERRLVERGQLVRVIAGNVRHVAIGANLERVLALDFEEVGDFPEDMGDGGVIQPGDLLSRGENPGPSRPQQERRQW